MTWKHFCSYGCPTLQNAIMSFPSWLLSSFHSSFTLLSSPHWCPWFSLRYLSMRWWGAGKASPPSTLTHTITHNENTMDNLKTWWDFRAPRKVWMTVGGEGCSASTCQSSAGWAVPVAVSAHNMGGNKAQCHGNHIKSTLKLIYLQSNESFVDIHVPFSSRCMFL